MDTTPIQAGTANITGQVLFYSKPEPLNKEQHSGIGFKQLDKPFAFAAGANVVPLAVAEFAPAGLSYPVIFAGETKTPLAVMGVQQGENLFIEADGTAAPDAYLPAYIRRYPFVLADDKPQDRMIVCLERGAAMLAEDGGDMPLFENGELSTYTQNAIDFCNDYENERRRTLSFIELISKLDLFEVRRANFTPRMPDGSQGEPQMVAEYYAISEDKLKALPNDKYLELRDNGALGQIYAHIVSQLGWDKLFAKALIKRQTDAQAQSGTATLN